MIFQIFTNKDYPSWCYPVINGATSIWERWNGYTEENGIMGGTEKGFEPQGVYTKEQAIVTMLRVYNNL